MMRWSTSCRCRKKFSIPEDARHWPVLLMMCKMREAEVGHRSKAFARRINEDGTVDWDTSPVYEPTFLENRLSQITHTPTDESCLVPKHLHITDEVHLENAFSDDRAGFSMNGNFILIKDWWKKNEGPLKHAIDKKNKHLVKLAAEAKAAYAVKQKQFLELADRVDISIEDPRKRLREQALEQARAKRALMPQKPPSRRVSIRTRSIEDMPQDTAAETVG